MQPNLFAAALPTPTPPSLLLVESAFGEWAAAHKNSDSASNYVDRVRIRDSSNSFGGPGRGSGWRQKSLSNIDLPTSYRGIAGGGLTGGGLGAGQFRYRDYDSGLYDLYSRIDSRREEYEDLYGVNPKAARANGALGASGGGASTKANHHNGLSSASAAAGGAGSGGGSGPASTSTTNGGRSSSSTAGGKSGGSKKRHHRSQEVIAYEKSASEHGHSHHHHHHHHHHHQGQGQGGGSSQQQQQQQFYSADSSDACSLRRTRSLAVIREESYNDLHLPGRGGARRSQLIPKAKLTDRNFFKERFSYIYDENGDVPEVPEGDASYTLARRFSTSQLNGGAGNGTHQQQPFPWHTDKSDLDSIDSSIFKHSLHQQNSFDGSRHNSIRSDSRKFVSQVEVHSQYSGVSGGGGSKHSDTGVDADLRLLDDLSLRDDEPSGGPRKASKTSTLDTGKKKKRNGAGSDRASFSSERPPEGRGKYGLREEDESGITIIEIKDSQVSAKSSSVISYDSIYLSSESDEKELLDDPLLLGSSPQPPPLPKDNRRRAGRRAVHDEIDDDDDDDGANVDLLDDIKFEEYEDLFHPDDLEHAESTIDTLYGQVTKPKPKIVAVEPKIHASDSLRRFIKNTSRSTIERLSLISNLKLRHEFGAAASEPTGRVTGGGKDRLLPLLPSAADADYQYNSLPDADVCKILRNSERIDAKLRRIADSEHERGGIHGDTTSGDGLDRGREFDSLPRLHNKSNLNLTRHPSDEETSLEESDKGAPSIEVVETPTKEVLSQASSKVYLKDLGLELDYENSVVTANSDQESDITIVAPQEDLEVPTPAIVVTPAEKYSTQGPKQLLPPSVESKESRQQSVIYSTFASTVGKHTTNRINFESKERQKPEPEALREVRTKLKPIPAQPPEAAPKVPLALAPTVKLGGKKVIVDEVAAKAVKREKQELEQQVSFPEYPLKKVGDRVSGPAPAGAASGDVISPQLKKPLRPTSEERKPPKKDTHQVGGDSGTSSTRHAEPIPIAKAVKPSAEGADSAGQADNPVKEKQGSPKVDHSSLFKDTNPFKEQARREIKNKVNDRPLFKGVRRFNSTENIYTSTPIIVTKTFNNCIKTNEVKTKSFDSLIVENNQGDNSSANSSKPKMPRPQVIQIVDSKQQQQQQQQFPQLNGADTLRKTAKNGQQTQKEFLHKVDAVRSYWSKMLDEVDQYEGPEGDIKMTQNDMTNSKNELLTGSGLCVSAIAVPGATTTNNNSYYHQASSQQSHSKNGNAERKSSVGSATSEASDSSKHTTSTKAASLASDGTITTNNNSSSGTYHSTNQSRQSYNASRHKYSTYQLDGEDEDDELQAFQSFSPTVEIIELDGHKQAALVKPRNAKELDFDHVRYKVMKSEMFQKNLLVNHRKAAQFDGLMQYLQDYSFQELLAHNNVVIIEPVRTKIEKISDKPPQTPAGMCRITNGALLPATGKRQQAHHHQQPGSVSSGIKKHFFYHPIRVNKELLDEELPSPDTVRNVRKLFEGTLRLGTAAKQAYEDAKANGTAGTFRKWDSASLSSGVSSSGDLSSPCDCDDGRTTTAVVGGGGGGGGSSDVSGTVRPVSASAELLCPAGAGEDELESHYVSQAVLEKIRECGSTVTYYGGRVLDKRTQHISTMTRAIMREIRGQDRQCGVCQPHGCPDRRAHRGDEDEDVDEEQDEEGVHEDCDEEHANGCPNSRRSLVSGERDGGLGVKFKLVKSNSCSSRLELAGTGKTPPDLLRPNGRIRGRHILEENSRRTAEVTLEEPEETVRDMVSRLESHATLTARTKPRIIESKCIEKYELDHPHPHGEGITINSQATMTGAERSSSSPQPTGNGVGRKSPTQEPPSSTNDPSILPGSVTVNNHINFVHHAPTSGGRSSSPPVVAAPHPPPIPGPLLIPDRLTPKPTPIGTPVSTFSTTSAERPPKVCRNKNVDLAFAATMKQIAGLQNGHGGGTVRPASAGVRKSASQASATSEGEPRQDRAGGSPPPHNNASSGTKTVTFNFTVQGEDVDHHGPVDVSVENGHKTNGATTVSVDQSENLRPSAIAEQRKTDELTSPKLVNWSTVGRFDERQYFANDRKLIEKRKYDDMEFEEFEVLDPNAPPSAEHYDSLNSK